MGMLGEQGRGLKFKWKRIYTALAPQELNLTPYNTDMFLYIPYHGGQRLFLLWGNHKWLS